MDDKVKKTTKQIIVGSIIYNVVLFLFSLAFFIIYCYNKKVDLNGGFLLYNIVKILLGSVVGTIFSIIMIIWMAITLDKALGSNDEKFAKNYIIKNSVFRNILFCIILIIVINENVLGFNGGIVFILSSLGTKIGAYLNPIIFKQKSI